MIAFDFKFEPRHAKFIVPAAGVLAGYVGGYGGAHLAFMAFESPFAAFPVIWLCFCLAGLAAMIPVDGALKQNAAHVDLLKVPAFWTAAALMLVSARFTLNAVFGAELPPFVSNLVLYFAGLLAIWVDEPESAALSWLKRLAAPKGPPRS